MQAGLVSVMMPAFNAAQYVAEAVSSVIAQSYRDWELVVVDDGSTDATATVVEQFPDPRLRLIRQANKGEAGARNTALGQMQGEFLAFLDADDAFLPHHLEVTVGYLLAHPYCGGVYTDGYHCDENGNRLQTLSSRRRGPFEGRVFAEVVRASDVFGPPVCIVLRQSIVHGLGLVFDEDIVIGPDWDFFTRYADAAPFGYITEHTCLYRVHSSNISTRVGSQRRALDLAKCRTKAIWMDNFAACPLDVRFAAFYDLLINLLRAFPDRQSQITQWPQFQQLPPASQATLLRLMASRALLDGRVEAPVADWLHRSRALNPGDKQGALLAAAYGLSPSLCRSLLQIKTWKQANPLATSPFSDLKQARSH